MVRAEYAIGNNVSMWNRTYDAWKRTHQCYIFMVMGTGVKGLVALFSFETLATFSETQFRVLIGAIHDQNPVANAVAMWVRLSDTFDFSGIFMSARPGSEEELRPNATMHHSATVSSRLPGSAGNISSNPWGPLLFISVKTEKKKKKLLDLQRRLDLSHPFQIHHQPLSRQRYET